MQVPQLLRDAGFRLTTMREHYGETQAQSVSDHKWIAMTAVNRPGMSGDSSSWKGWGHVRWFIEEVPAGAA
ncbi:CRISPR-associated protein [Mycobacterium tuberculosis]|nr:CRISPR-associated protein [Mycobacterium tuberculosis]